MSDEDTDDQVLEMNRLARREAGGQVDDHSIETDVTVKDKPPAQIPWVELPRDGRLLSTFAADVGRVCSESGKVFRRDSVPVMINRDDGRIEPVDAVAFRTDFEELALCYKLKRRETDEGTEVYKVAATMSKEVSTATLKSEKFRFSQPVLEKVNQVPQPIMREDGCIELLKPGYDAESKIYTRSSPFALRVMSKDEAHHTLHDLHCEFDFAGWNADRSAARDLDAQVAAMLAFFAPDIIDPLDSRLGVLHNANSHRTGKTLLFKIAAVPVLGQAYVRGMPKNDEEFRKMLDAVALGARPYLILDDVKGNFQNNDLNSFMTSAYYNGRLMHSQIDYVVPVKSMVFITGHNLTVESDMAGRLLQTKLVMEEADVRAKKIKRVIDDKWLSKPAVRSEILSALWSLIVAWDKDGRPKGKTIMGGFREWCDTYGGIVINGGFGDPCLRPSEEDDPDTEFDDMRTLVAELAKTINKDEGEKLAEFTFEELLETCVDNSCFSWMIKGKWKTPKDGPKFYDADPDTNARMGKLWANKYGGRLFTLKDGTRVQFGKRGKNRHRRYQVTLIG